MGASEVERLMHAIKREMRRRGYACVDVSVRAEWQQEHDEEPWQWIALVDAADTTTSDTFEKDQGSAIGPEAALRMLLERIRGTEPNSAARQGGASNG